jgi:biotin carboxylase
MRLLVIGISRKCHHRLKARGHEIVLIMPRSKMSPVDLSGPYEHIVVINDAATDDEWINIARAFHDTRGFDAIVPLYDQVQRAAHIIATALNVYCTADIDLLHVTMNKHAMREKLKLHGIASCRYQFATSRQAVIDAITYVGLPCIVKPVAGEASLGVSKITSRDEIEAAIEWVGESNISSGVIVEEFLIGDEYSVEAISSRGKHHILAITKKFKNHQTFVELGHVIPAPLTCEDRTQIETYICGVLTSLGFNDSPSHTEIILTADGARIVETHTRIAGDRIPDLVRYASGIDLHDLVAVQGLGVDISSMLPETISHSQSAAIWFASPEMPSNASLESVRRFEEIKNLPFIKEVALERQIGSSGTSVRNSFDRSAFAIAVGSNAQEAITRAQEAIHGMDFMYKWNPQASAL